MTDAAKKLLVGRTNVVNRVVKLTSDPPSSLVYSSVRTIVSCAACGTELQVTHSPFKGHSSFTTGTSRHQCAFK